ncbi:uncharacterized protein BJX67DRAFT_352114 [Aspergillus lucknowensis]|uniref:Secreted peptide n=1 Tax=Aspergillus lucknowensis TaxID=176173 RepID=A0ABR4LT44_9EURO
MVRITTVLISGIIPAAVGVGGVGRWTCWVVYPRVLRVVGTRQLRILTWWIARCVMARPWLHVSTMIDGIIWIV